jgi:hypothetical protein
VVVRVRPLSEGEAKKSETSCVTIAADNQTIAFKTTAATVKSPQVGRWWCLSGGRDDDDDDDDDDDEDDDDDDDDDNDGGGGDGGGGESMNLNDDHKKPSPLAHSLRQC